MLERTKQVFAELLDRIVAAVVWLMPGLLAMVVILLVTALIAIGVRAAVRRFLHRFDFDRRMRDWGLVPAGAVVAPEGGPTVWVARLGFWLVMALGFVAGLSVFDAAATRGLAERLAGYIPNVVVALIIFITGAAASRFLERSVLISAVNMGVQSARLVALGVRWLVLVFGTAMALVHLGIGGGIVTLSFGILFGGIVLALALAVGLGARDMVERSLEKRFSTPPPEEKEQDKQELSHL